MQNASLLAYIMQQTRENRFEPHQVVQVHILLLQAAAATVPISTRSTLSIHRQACQCMRKQKLTA